ncbi:MAG TPA: hypothetical protein PLU40_01215 [Methanoculleus sp.]|nr:hypothetical protein [Methanoculleus sp.]HPZ32330.1 hypothetical protein [Methanoculleus sp.]HQD23625.1 hypothetical protein [Methanoculleus sp.]HUM76850.1 hypothetical protein [Methanoculleus sp.]
MERSELTTFACLAERAARYPTIARRSQIRKEVYIAADGAVGRPSPGAERRTQPFPGR